MTNEVSKGSASTAVVEVSPVSQSGALLSLIERAAKDPAVDIDKMERLLAMHEGVVARESEMSFNRAMNAAQTDMRPIAANKLNTQTKSLYPTYDKLDAVLRPIYTSHGFSLSFDEGDSPKAEHVRVLCYVAHVDGFTRTYHRDIPADGKGAKGGDVMTKTHAAGAAGSYGARYLLKGIFNIAIGEDDNDGNQPQEIKLISEAQVKILETMIKDTGTVLENFLKFGGVASLSEIRADKFEQARGALAAKMQQKSKQ